MSAKLAIVTGASDGIGKEIARSLGRQGMSVVMIGRNREKTANAVEEIAMTSESQVEMGLADFASLQAVRNLAANLNERYPRINVLVSNAGIFRTRRTVTVDGYEETIAVNHLAAFLLTNLLTKRLKESAPSRVVVVASAAHFGVNLDLDDLQSERRFRPMRVYGRSKLANVMFTYSLARRLAAEGVTANSVHPGFVASNLGSGNRAPIAAMARLTKSQISVEQASDTPVWLAHSGDVGGVTGQYFENRATRESSMPSYDEEAQERLWVISTRLVDLQQK